MGVGLPLVLFGFLVVLTMTIPAHASSTSSPPCPVSFPSTSPLSLLHGAGTYVPRGEAARVWVRERRLRCRHDRSQRYALANKNKGKENKDRTAAHRTRRKRGEKTEGRRRTVARERSERGYGRYLCARGSCGKERSALKRKLKMEGAVKRWPAEDQVD